MFSDFTAWLTTALGIMSIASLAGVGLLRGAVLQLRERLAEERTSNESLRRQRADDHAEIAQLKADLGALTRVVTGEAHWTAIGEALDEHHDDAKSHWSKEVAVLEQIRDDIREDRLMRRQSDRGGTKS